MQKNENQQYQQPQYIIPIITFEKDKKSQKSDINITKQKSNKYLNNMTDQYGIGLWKFSSQIYSTQYTDLFNQSFQRKKIQLDHFFQKYIPIDQQFIIHIKKNILNLNIFKFNNKVIIGQLINKKCCGKFIIILKNGSLYQGQMLQNKREGKGTYVHANLGWYKGQFKDDLKHGEGLQILYNKSVYKGQFLNGLKHDEGIYVDSQGNIYQGSWKLGIMHGKGTLKSSKSTYTGNFANWLKHGSGVQYFVNGDIYRGQYQNGRFDGIGTYEWKSQGAIYEGNFKNGLRHGKGKWQRGQTKYNGSYVQGLKQGYGQLYFPSGNFYKGSYFRDKSQGYGQMFWTDSSFYKGQWKNGIQNGKGQIYLSGGDIVNGIFENSIMVQIIPTLYQKQMQISNLSIHQLLNDKKNQYHRPRTLSDTMGFIKRKKLIKIDDSTIHRDKNTICNLNNKLYFKSPEKSNYSDQCCGVCQHRRNSSFRVKHKNKKIANNSYVR